MAHAGAAAGGFGAGWAALMIPHGIVTGMIQGSLIGGYNLLLSACTGAAAIAALWSAALVLGQRALDRRAGCRGALFGVCGAGGELAALVVYLIAVVEPLCAGKTGFAAIASNYLLLCGAFSLGLIACCITYAAMTFAYNWHKRAGQFRALTPKEEHDE